MPALLEENLGGQCLLCKQEFNDTHKSSAEHGWTSKICKQLHHHTQQGIEFTEKFDFSDVESWLRPADEVLEASHRSHGHDMPRPSEVTRGDPILHICLTWPKQLRFIFILLMAYRCLFCPFSHP